MRAELTGFPSIDKLWLKYYGEEVLHRPLLEGSMYDYLTSCNVDQLDSAALNYFGKKVTHRQMQEKIYKSIVYNMPYEYIADALCGRRQFYEYRQEFIKRVASAMDMLPEQKGQEHGN